jgi:predicted porin
MPLARVGQPAFQNPAGVGARYTAGPIDAAIAYDRNAADKKTFGIYGAYDFGFIRPMFQFEKGDNCISAAAVCTATGNTVGTGKEKIKAFSAGLTAPFGAFLLRTGFLRIKSDIKNVNGTDRDATKFGFGGDYNLSKRTNLYATVGKWTGDRALGIAGTNTAARDGTNKAMFDIGMTHRF